MTEQFASIAKQRGKVVTLLVVCAFVLCMFHPEVTPLVWGPTALAVGALAGVEAWATKGAT